MYAATLTFTTARDERVDTIITLEGLAAVVVGILAVEEYAPTMVCTICLVAISHQLILCKPLAVCSITEACMGTCGK